MKACGALLCLLFWVMCEADPVQLPLNQKGTELELTVNHDGDHGTADEDDKVTCPPNAEHLEWGPACIPSCKEPNCSSCFSGCFCKPGYVLKGRQCVKLDEHNEGKIEGFALLEMDAKSYITTYEQLNPGDTLFSQSKGFKAVFQTDSNFVVYGWKPLWASNTMGKDGSRVLLQPDGNLVMYTSDDTAIWSTNTWVHNTNNQMRLTMTNAGILVLDRNDINIWHS